MNGANPDTSDAGIDTGSTGKSYVVKYTANDAAGNTRIRTKTITVIDDALPIVTLNAGYGTAERVVIDGQWNGTAIASNQAITLNQSSTNEYIKKGVTITDEGADGGAISLSHDDAELIITTNKTGATNFKHNLQGVTNAVTTTTVGSYLITYTAQDIAGIETVRTKTVNVVDKIGPVITMNGSRIHYVLSSLNGGSSTYVDPGIIARDYAGPGLTQSAGPEIEGNPMSKDSTPGWTTDSGSTVNMDVYNTYTVTYTAIDEYSNSTTDTRTVKVVKEIPHEVLITDDTIRHVFSTVNYGYMKFGDGTDNSKSGQFSMNNRQDVNAITLLGNGLVGIGTTTPEHPFML